MRVVFIFSLLLSMSSAFSLALAAAEIERPRIIRPNPADFALIRNFQPEWCAAQLCFGKSSFGAVARIRSILVRSKNGDALFVEDEIPAVELMKPNFGVVGPVNSVPGFNSEIGQASLTFDGRGEVDSVRLHTPSLGVLEGAR
jgi:hypothetical protein